MTDDAIDALERTARIIKAGQASLDILEAMNPEYVRGARFVYTQAMDTIQKEVDYIKDQRAARLA